MWGALKKDFGEFVSTVATDANETLQAIDQKMDEPLVGQRTDDQGGDEGYMGQEASPIDLDTGMVLDHVVGDVEEEDGDEVFSWKSPDENPTAEEMRDQLVLCEDVFKDSLVSESDESTSKEEEEEKEEDRSDSNETPLLETVATATKPSNDDAARSFLEEFDVASKTDEISALLEENVALKTTFSMVATDQSEVTYSDFWTRYYFRIADPDRVAETYGVYYRKELEAFEQRREEAEAAARDAAANDNLARGISNVTNFFGGVVNRLTQEDDEGGADEAGVDESMDVDDESAPQTSGLGGFFNSVTGGGVGRPPFVLNTAVSDDEYDDYQAPEEEDDDDSEVELGWDDDDEDLESDDDDEQNTSATMQFKDGDDLSETVDFKDAEKEGLLDQLEQARAERDALQKTVAMQTEELKKARTADIAAISPPATVLEGGDKDEEVQKLSIQLFEKDSELAALRAKLEDDKNEAKDQQQQQETLEKLLQSIAEKDAELEALRRSTDERIEMLQNTVDQKTTEQERLRTDWDSEKEALLLEKEANRQDTSVVTAEKADDAEMLALRSKIAEQEQKIEELVASKDAAEKANSVEIVALRSKVAEQEQKIEELVESTTAQEADGVEMASLRSKVAEQEQKIEDLVMSKATAQEADGAEMAALRSKVDEQEKKIEELAASKAAATEELQHQTEQSAQEQEALRTTLQLKIEGLEQRLLVATNQEESDVAAMEALISEKEATNVKLQTALAECQSKLAKVTERNSQDQAALRADLEAQIDTLIDQSSKRDDEYKQTKKQHTLEVSELGEQLASSRAVLDLLKVSNIAEATNLLASLEANRSELERSKAELSAALTAPASPGSSSTGVQVRLPSGDDGEPVSMPSASPNEPGNNADADDDDDDDGWGDDW